MVSLEDLSTTTLGIRVVCVVGRLFRISRLSVDHWNIRNVIRGPVGLLGGGQ